MAVAAYQNDFAIRRFRDLVIGTALNHSIAKSQNHQIRKCLLLLNSDKQCPEPCLHTLLLVLDSTDTRAVCVHQQSHATGEIALRQAVWHARNAIYAAQTYGAPHYLFSDLAAGNYQLQFLAPASYQFSPAHQGSDSSLDSDADTFGFTAVFALGANQFRSDLDAGLFTTLGSVVGGG